MNLKYVHLTNGNYLGFISNGILFSRDGVYLGWLEGNTVWDKGGQYRGQLTDLNGGNYILKHKFMVNPLPRVPRMRPTNPTPPTPASNRTPIQVPLPFEDAFDGSSFLR